MTMDSMPGAEPARLSVADCYSDCYSGGERVWMVRGQRARAACLAPLLRALVHCKVTPDHLTLLSFAFGLAFWPLFFTSKAAALAALALHVFLDGVDGPLARHTGVASRRGSFTDTLSDQVVVTTTTIALMVAGVVSPTAGSLYIFTYAVVVAFAMVRNALDVPYSWLIRPRFVVYTWIALDAWWWPGSLESVLWLSAGLLTLKMLSGFMHLRRRL